MRASAEIGKGRSLEKAGARGAWLLTAGSIRALSYLARQPEEPVTLLCVSPREDAGYLECGRLLLEVAMHRCRLEARDAHVNMRIEVGDPLSRMREVCREERPVLVTMGTSDLGGVRGSPALRVPARHGVAGRGGAIGNPPVSRPARCGSLIGLS